MDIQTVGPWILLGVGTASLLGAVIISLRGKAPRGLWMMWVFGVAISGVGVYGPAFLEPYGKFVQPLLAMLDTPSKDTYGDVLNKVANGELPPRYAELGLAYALERPIEGMDELLAEAIRTAKDPGGKAVLEHAQISLNGKERVADALLERPDLTKEDIKRFDPATRLRVVHGLRKLTPEELRRRNLNRAILDELSTARVRPTGNDG